MTHREHFFSVLESKKPDKMPFFPDITDWYVSKRTPQGEPRKFGAAQFIPDSDPFHKQPSTLPEKYKDFTLFDFYREFDWGFPVHISDWFESEYTDGVERTVEIIQNEKVITFKTPNGNLERREKLASDGTWSPHIYFVISTIH